MHHPAALIFNDNSWLRREKKRTNKKYIKQELNVVCNNIKVGKLKELSLVEDKNNRDC